MTGINERLTKLENMLTETMSKLEDPEEDEYKGNMCIRHEFIQDYSLEFSINHPNRNYYKIEIDPNNLPYSKNARCLILRIVCYDSGVANLFSKCTIRQALHDNGVNLANNILPVNGVPTIFETFMPWESDKPNEILIEWEKNQALVQPVQQMSQTFAQGSSYNLYSHSMGSTTHNAIPAMSATGVQGPKLSGMPAQNLVTHGIIYMGIAGYME
jgi:hypothetical protein